MCNFFYPHSSNLENTLLSMRLLSLIKKEIFFDDERMHQVHAAGGRKTEGSPVTNGRVLISDQSAKGRRISEAVVTPIAFLLARIQKLSRWATNTHASLCFKQNLKECNMMMCHVEEVDLKLVVLVT